jgi:phosphatidylserine/phosphatidylglycerophosphate/cardiolipin synthase-like enzyme
VDGSYSNGSYPINTTPGALEAAIINRINNATTSIDASIYNINRTTIVEALTNAYNNGVQVRYVTDDETGNLALQNPTPPFPVIKGNIDGLMHNKFFVFDADSEDESWVIMGSTNMTEQNLANDFNNMVAIQDQSLAKTYTKEFQEIWGSDGPNPGIFNVKFGVDKSDDTPHLFNINGMTVESYFSPTDNTSIGIGGAISTANDDFQFAVLTFTNNELGNAVLNAHNAGVDVRGIIDNINDQGSEYQYLLDNGVNVSPDNTTVQTHHKYCIVDATNPASDPQVVTGSHNWSASADTRNDENTLIFHDADIANIFLQEFEARWCEATAGSNCVTSSTEINGIDGFEATVFPNPAVDQSTIKMEVETQNDVIINVWDFNGRMLQSTILRDVQGEVTEQLFLNGMPSGTYIVTFKIDDKISSRKLEIVK